MKLNSEDTLTIDVCMYNYQAIANSTSMSKLFESIVASEVGSHDDADKYQFGFKKGHSTSLCTRYL